MARKYTGGAEFNAGATADMDYDSTSGTTITYDATTVRSGAFSWKFVCAASGPFLTRQFVAASNVQDTFYRAYINVTSITTASLISIFTARSAASGNVVNIRLTRDSATTYHIALYNEQTGLQVGSDSPTMFTSQWYRIEMSYIFTPGTFSAYVNGNLFATGNATSTRDLTTLRWGSIDASTMTIFFDDIAVNDNTAGGTQAGLPGEGRVIRLKPDAAGDVNTFATQTGGTAGAANNFTRVNEVLPDDATTFNGSSTLNQEDLLNIGASGISSLDTINVVEVWGRYRNSTADPTGAFKFEIEKAAAGTITQSASIVPNSTTWVMNAAAAPKIPPIVLYVDPDGNAWSKTTLDSAQIGYKQTVNPGTAGRRNDVTNVSLVVEYTQALIAKDIQPLQNTIGANVTIGAAVRAANY